MKGRAPATAPSTPGRELSPHPTRTVPATATAIQSERPCSTYRDNATRDPSRSPPPAAPTKIAKGDYPYGIPVPGKPHLVESPYSPGKYIDVEGFPPGTEVKDPYTDKIFLVPKA